MRKLRPKATQAVGAKVSLPWERCRNLGEDMGLFQEAGSEGLGQAGWCQDARRSQLLLAFSVWSHFLLSPSGWAALGRSGGGKAHLWAMNLKGDQHSLLGPVDGS